MILLEYWNENLKTGLANLKNIYQFPRVEMLHVEIHQGKLHYRLKGSSKRISYDQVKKGLIKKRIIIKEELPF
jgi:hypothetical protein